MPGAGAHDRLHFFDIDGKHDRIGQMSGMMRLVVAVVLAHRGGGQQTIADGLPKVVDQRIGE
jgi:hypothetical protein